MRFQKYLYRFDAGSDTIWRLEPGYVYTIRTINMSGANEATDNCSGFRFYLRNTENHYMQFELGLIPNTVCCNDRAITGLDIRLVNGYNPFIENLDNDPNRMICIIEYEREEQQAGKNYELPGGVI